jgi:hypothetical protein
MHPMAKEYTLMQPFENVQMQPIATHKISTPLPPHRRAAQATLATSKYMERAPFSTFQQRKAVAAHHIAVRLLHEQCHVNNTEPPLQHTCIALHLLHHC